MIDPTYQTPGMAMSRRKDRRQTPGLWVATNLTLSREKSRMLISAVAWETIS